jgi:hypothetical protein
VVFGLDYQKDESKAKFEVRNTYNLTYQKMFIDVFFLVVVSNFKIIFIWNQVEFFFQVSFASIVPNNDS